MCHKGTAEIGIRWLVCLTISGIVLWGQTTAAADAVEWRKVGTAAVDRNLAGPATGPVDRVWFSPEGGLLFARTGTGRVFETADFARWTEISSAAVTLPPSVAGNSPLRTPESGAKFIYAAADPARVYALGRQLYGSEDGGSTWANLTAFRSSSIVGGGFHDVAVAPDNPEQIVLANDFGVWRSMDGGLSWSGLNLALPNLQVRRILATQGPAGGTRIQDGTETLELPPGQSVWQQAQGVTDNERALMSQLSVVFRTEISAVATNGDRIYAGSADGRLWMLRDGVPSPVWTSGGGRVERIFVDPAAPDFALAALGGSGPHVLRSTNGGGFWDALDDSSLPNAAAHAITADRAAGAVYVATDKGVFYGHTDLQNPVKNPVQWVNLTASLTGPDGVLPAEEVKLDPAGAQLYIALDSYGVYATLAPHRLLQPQIVNAADYSTRPAAPGSLLSVLGVRVNAARGDNFSYPVFAAADGESQIQVPFEATGPSVSLQLDTPSGSRTLPVAVQPVSPAILVGRDGTPVLFDADTGLPLDGRNGAHSNGRVQIMATGLGKVTPSWPTGIPAPPDNPPAVDAPVRAFLNGTELQVTRATLAGRYVGFYIVEVQLPAVTNLGTSSLYLSADGQESNHVQIFLEP